LSSELFFEKFHEASFEKFSPKSELYSLSKLTFEKFDQALYGFVPQGANYHDDLEIPEAVLLRPDVEVGGIHLLSLTCALSLSPSLSLSFVTQRYSLSIFFWFSRLSTIFQQKIRGQLAPLDF